MLQNYNKWRLAGVFFGNPMPESNGFQLRELSRLAKIAPTSTKIYLKKLKADGIIKDSLHRPGYPLYSADRESAAYKFYKVIYNLSLIHESGILEYLQEACMPDAIVLFGSFSKGEDTKDSDIDLFLLCSEEKTNLIKFEKKIGRRVSLFFSENFNSLSSELRNNIINGIKLKGYLKVF